VRVIAKPEPVVTVTAHDPLSLLRAAYYLGNRHVPVEVEPNYLRFSPDSVIEAMLMPMPVQLCHEILPFFPEAGAYATHAH
jgi:urease accessory protein